MRARWSGEEPGEGHEKYEQAETERSGAVHKKVGNAISRWLVLILLFLPCLPVDDAAGVAASSAAVFIVGMAAPIWVRHAASLARSSWTLAGALAARLRLSPMSSRRL